MWLGFLHRGEESQCIAYIHNTFFQDFKKSMIGKGQGEQTKMGDTSVNVVAEELKMFGKECKGIQLFLLL